MDRLQSMQVFVRVAQHVGFAAAARDLRISPAAVSKHVNALESSIGTRLFDRTTRRVGLTEAGRVYLERCLECLHALEDADASMSELAKAPTGLLRVTAPIDFGENLLPVVTAVMSAHPNIVVDLRFSNRVMEMVEEGIDVAVRIAQSLDGRYVARPLARSRLGVFGAPEYLRRHGRPRTPEDLSSHRNLVFTEPRPMQELAFVGGGREVRVKVNAVMLTNSGEALMAAARQAVGLAVAPSFLACGDLEAGRIEPSCSTGRWLSTTCSPSTRTGDSSHRRSGCCSKRSPRPSATERAIRGGPKRCPVPKRRSQRPAAVRNAASPVPDQARRQRAASYSRARRSTSCRAGMEPTIPAVHCAMTSFGLPTMNSGAPMTGMRKAVEQRRQGHA